MGVDSNLIHTDDCDCYGTSLDVLHEINDIMNEEWTTEIVDPSYILGVRRVLDTSDPKGWVITCTMPSFIMLQCSALTWMRPMERGRLVLLFPKASFSLI